MHIYLDVIDQIAKGLTSLVSIMKSHQDNALKQERNYEEMLRRELPSEFTLRVDGRNISLYIPGGSGRVFLNWEHAYTYLDGFLLAKKLTKKSKKPRTL